MKLQNFDAEIFLRDYWQKKPLLIRKAFADFEDPLSPEELAGLACEAQIESRIVQENGAEGGKWQLESGPFTFEKFEGMPRSHWTLLVQAVDQALPEVAELLKPFRFIPDWRLDDIMISFAADQGSVGPHYDQYDVFLIQGMGKRRWKVGQHCSGQDKLLDGTPLCILDEFNQEEEWVLEAGDILYLPPGASHWGIAEGEEGCMTYSIGFRAPSMERIVTGFADEIGQSLTDFQRYADPDLVKQENPAEITPKAIERLKGELARLLEDEEKLLNWFGQEMTERKYTDLEYAPEEPLSFEDFVREAVAADGVEKSEQARFAFYQLGKNEILFFVDAQSRKFKGQVANLLRILAQQQSLNAAQMEAILPEVYELYQAGLIRLKGSFEAEEY